MPKLKWTDADEIGYQLHQAHPGLDPLSVSFTALRDMVVGLAEFAGDPAVTSEKALEAIQMVWLEYFRE
jgi:FeS assembly protein IscX